MRAAPLVLLLAPLLMPAAAQAAAGNKADSFQPARMEEVAKPTLRAQALCPPATNGPCALKNPTGESGWRLLTPDVDVEPTADGGWLLDFSKLPNKGSNGFTLRVLTVSGKLHLIDIRIRR